MPEMSINLTIKKIVILVILVYLFKGLSAQKYMVEYHFNNKDTTENKQPVSLQSNFQSKSASVQYIDNLKSYLNSKGYATASIDSIRYDSAFASVYLYIGKNYHWKIVTDSLPPEVLSAVNIYKGSFGRKKVQYDQIKKLENNILNYYENTGYPFARVYSESSITTDSIITTFKADRGVQYHIDSIRVIGKAKIKNNFLQHYLDIFNNDIYNRQKLSRVSSLLDNLPFLQQEQPWDLMMLGTGATMNLYLQPKRSSEINALIGFLPGNSITGKTKITADVRLNLKNALSGGETILLNWQQLEAQSPKLDLGFNQPYLFNTPYGIDFSFGMLKKDSSYLLLNSLFGIEYLWTANQSIKLFYQVRNSYLLQGGVDTNLVKLTRQLPAYMDVNSGSGGLGFHFENLNYRFNPRKGFEITTTASAGIRKVSRNSDIVKLKDPTEPDFDFASLYDTIKLKTYIITTTISAAHYNSLGKNSVFKIGLQGGWLGSPQIFQNELFRIGGYKILRGFDEESIYADRYGVLTAEYRFLTGLNSYLFGFSDLGLTHTSFSGARYSNSFISTGLGLELETKFGLLNISYAIGKRNNIKFDIKNSSKIHFGYINYF